MTVPTQATYSVAATSAFANGFKTLLDAGSGPAVINVRTAAGLLLASVPLTDPCGTVSGTTGQLICTPATPDPLGVASGTAAYAEFCDSTGLVHLAMPVAVGEVAISGFCVLNSLVVVAGAPLKVLSAVVG